MRPFWRRRFGEKEKRKRGKKSEWVEGGRKIHSVGVPLTEVQPTEL